MKNHLAYQIAAMKSALVERILIGKISVTDAAASVKKSRFTIYDWMTRYKAACIPAGCTESGSARSASAQSFVCHDLHHSGM
ncbi:hypothetical protein EXS65_04130 [Candidatus Peribacteria bacterium]|nr:hypothetical protein [Candidatus Peribacteria bacterium]